LHASLVPIPHMRGDAQESHCSCPTCNRRLAGFEVSTEDGLRRHAVHIPDPALATVLTGVLELYRVPVPTMAIQTTYTQARADLARLCDAAAKDNEVVIITRRGAQDVALVSAAELRSLRETAHLLRSPRNAERLLRALVRARARKERPQSLRSLRREVGLDEAEG
jgi:antitoxin YefM